MLLDLGAAGEAAEWFRIPRAENPKVSVKAHVREADVMPKPEAKGEGSAGRMCLAVIPETHSPCAPG